MKRFKRVLLMLSIAAALVCITVGATIAYLTSTDSVTNTFTVGKVEIALDETGVDVYGNPPSSPMPTTGNAYKLVPGREYKKNPTVHVKLGSEKCWLFVKVENGISEIEAAPTIALQMDYNNWTVIDETNHIYAYDFAVDARTSAYDVPVFSKFTIKNDAAVENYEAAQIRITAYAVQSYGFTTAPDAWNGSGFAS